jgi:hypothetical protein
MRDGSLVKPRAPDARVYKRLTVFLHSAEMLSSAQNSLELPMACLLGQLEYNPRHYGQEEGEAPQWQEAIKPALTWR